MAGPSYIFGGSTGQTAEGLKRQRDFGRGVLEQGSSVAPAQGGWAEGLARMLTGGVGGYFEGEAQAQMDAADPWSGMRVPGASAPTVPMPAAPLPAGPRFRMGSFGPTRPR